MVGMTPEQRAARLHHHMYETCEGIREQSERIVALEELVMDAHATIESLCGIVENSPGCAICPVNQDDDKACGSAEVYCRMRELGVEVDG